MAVKKDLSIKYLGVDCINPFFLSSSPVGGNYDMVAKCYETGWGGCFFKTVGIFVADECSPRFDQTNKEGLPWVGFKNMEQISDKPTEKNFEFMYSSVNNGLKRRGMERACEDGRTGRSKAYRRKLLMPADDITRHGIRRRNKQ